MTKYNNEIGGPGFEYPATFFTTCDSTLCYLCRKGRYNKGICERCGAHEPGGSGTTNYTEDLKQLGSMIDNITIDPPQSEIIKGYHKKIIQKGVLGEPSKIREEFEEFMDSIEQDNPVMALIELSDLIGAIEAYAEKNNITLEHLINMKNATKRAFETGHRK
jgi:hypothetical protein